MTIGFLAELSEDNLTTLSLFDLSDSNMWVKQRESSDFAFTKTLAPTG